MEKKKIGNLNPGIFLGIGRKTSMISDPKITKILSHFSFIILCIIIK